MGVHQVQLAAHGLAQPDDGVLGGRVGGAAGGAELAGLRGDVDDVAAVAGDHLLERDLHAEDHAVEVDVDLALGRQVVLVDEAADLHDPGVVDQHVERAELALGLVEEGREGLALGHVERQRDGARAELIGGGARGVEVDISDRDLHALAEQRLRGGTADPARSPGDRCGLSGEDAGLLGHVLPPGLLGRAAGGRRKLARRGRSCWPAGQFCAAGLGG